MSESALKRTPLHERHRLLGARMGAFAGWSMPLQYTTPRAEHTAVRERSGVFDVSHMGQIEVAGARAREALARVLTNNIDRLGVGEGQYTLMLTDDGGVIDDLIVYRLVDRFLLVVNAGNVLACVERLEELLPAEVEWADRSWEVAMLALQGRDWQRALAQVADPTPLADLKRFSVAEVTVADAPCLVARTGYTGEPGVEIMCPWDAVGNLWDALMGLPEGLAPTPAGLVARDTLRLEMGYPLYGQELSRERGPLEAGLLWACDLVGARFAGAEALLARIEAGPAECLVGFRFREPGLPRPGLTIGHDGAPVGTVTSGTLSPTLGVGVGMAYLPPDLGEPGTELTVDVRGSAKAAVVASRPLVETSQ